MPRTSQANDFHFREPTAAPPLPYLPPQYQSRVIIFTAAKAACLFLFTPIYFSLPVALTCAAIVDIATFKKDSLAFTPTVVSVAFLFKLLRTSRYVIGPAFNAVSFTLGLAFGTVSRPLTSRYSRLAQHPLRKDPITARPPVRKDLDKASELDGPPVTPKTSSVMKRVATFLKSCSYTCGLITTVLENPDALFLEAPVEKLTTDICFDNWDVDWDIWRIPSRVREPVPEGMVRVRWYRGLDLVGASISYLTADFPLDHDGNLNLEAIQDKWGLFNCVPVDCGRYVLRLFRPQNPNVLSALAVKVLTDQHSCLRVIEEPPAALQCVRKVRAATLDFAETTAYELKWKKERYALLIVGIFFASMFYFIRIYVFGGRLLSVMFLPVRQLFPSMLSAFIQFAHFAFQICCMPFKILVNFYVEHYLVIAIVLFIVCASFITFLPTEGPDPAGSNYV